jgi:hypothetical protein
MFQNTQSMPLSSPLKLTNRWFCTNCGVNYKGNYRCLRCGKPGKPVESK